MGAGVLGPRVATRVTIKPGKRVETARLEFVPQDVLGHAPFEHIK
jgi:hypothetical protein